MPVLWGKINGILVKEKFDSLGIILDSGASSSIILGNYTEKLRETMAKMVHWITQWGGFNTNYITKVGIIMFEVDAT